MPQRAGLPWALCHRNVMLHGGKAVIPHPPTATLSPNLLTTCTHAHALLTGYIVMQRRATDTFITPVVIRNKPHYTQSLWFMINICKGCGRLSSPSNPLISLNKKNIDGGRRWRLLRGKCVCVGGWRVSCRGIPAMVWEIR